jgi:predicted dehydrogenase
MIMVKDVVQSGVLGQIYYIQTGGGRRRGIPTPFGTTFIEDATAGLGALADIGCYSLDMVLNAIGYPKPLTVSGYKSDFFGTDPNYSGYKKCGHPEYYKKFGVDDFAAAFVRLEGGIILDFRIAWAMNLDTAGDTIIYGTKGSLRIPSTECWNGTIGGDLVIYHEVAGKQVETKIPQIFPKAGAPTNFDKKIRTFLDACKNGTPAPVPSSQILYNQAILDGIAKSSDLGREIEIEIPEI